MVWTRDSNASMIPSGPRKMMLRSIARHENAVAFMRRICPSNPSSLVQKIADATDDNGITTMNWPICLNSRGRCTGVDFRLGDTICAEIRPNLLKMFHQNAATRKRALSPVECIPQESKCRGIAIDLDIWRASDNVLNVTDALLCNNALSTATLLDIAKDVLVTETIPPRFARDPSLRHQFKKLARVIHATSLRASQEIWEVTARVWSDSDSDNKSEILHDDLFWHARPCLSDTIEHLATESPHRPCKPAIRSFACATLALLRLCGRAVILGESTPQLFYGLSVDFLDDLQQSDDPPLVTIACANHLSWGLGAVHLDDGDVIGCPVAFDIARLSPKARRNSIDFYRDHPFFGAPCCDAHCYHSAVAILVATGRLVTHEQVRPRSYGQDGENGPVFIHPYL